MNGHSSANLYCLFLFFIAPLFSMHGALSPVEKLMNNLKEGPSSDENHDLMEKAYDPESVSVNKVWENNGMTGLSAILGSRIESNGYKENLIRTLKEIAKKKKEAINLTQENNDKTTPLEVILAFDYSNFLGDTQLKIFRELIGYIQDINAEQKNLYSTEYQLVTEENIIQLLSVICCNQSLFVNNKVELMDEIIAINPDLLHSSSKKLKVNINEKKDRYNQTLLEVILGRNYGKLDPNEQVILMKKIYELARLSEPIKLNDLAKNQIKKLFNSLQLYKSSRDELTKFTGLKPNLITRGRYYAQENTKTTIFTLLVILGTIIYGVWQYVKKQTTTESSLDDAEATVTEAL